MPTYEFRCQDCGHRFSIQVSWKERDGVTCPECGGHKLQQLFTGINIFAGSGGCGSPAGASSPFS